MSAGLPVECHTRSIVPRPSLQAVLNRAALDTATRLLSGQTGDDRVLDQQFDDAMSRLLATPARIWTEDYRAGPRPPL